MAGKPKKPGRKPLKPHKKRTQVIRILVTPPEEERIWARAKRKKQSVSSYARDVLLRAAK